MKIFYKFVIFKYNKYYSSSVQSKGVSNGVNSFKGILRIFIKSAIICFSITFVMAIVNLIMGIHIGLRYYFMMATVLTVCLSSGLVLLNSRRLFAARPKVLKKVKRAPVKKTQVSHTRVQRRKIS